MQGLRCLLTRNLDHKLPLPHDDGSRQVEAFSGVGEAPVAWVKLNVCFRGCGAKTPAEVLSGCDPILLEVKGVAALFLKLINFVRSSGLICKILDL